MKETKDWSERFERAQGKQRPVRVWIGVLILIAKGWSIFGDTRKSSPGVLGCLDLYPPTNAEAVGYDMGSIGLWPLAVWLIVSGVRTRRPKIPAETAER